MAAENLEAERHESEAQRVDRNMAELLQELRVAGIGVQVLFGFLLSLPFTNRFTRLDGAQRTLYVATLLLAAAAIALLTAPVAYHRLVFRRHEKGRLLRTSNALALAGLATVGLAISGAVILVVSVVVRGPSVAIIGVLTVAIFAGLWGGLPLSVRWSAARRGLTDPAPHDGDDGGDGPRPATTRPGPAGAATPTVEPAIPAHGR